MISSVRVANSGRRSRARGKTFVVLNLLHRTGFLALIACYLVMSTPSGFLILEWVVSPPKVSGESHPCAGRGCPCASASDCRSACCCAPRASKVAKFVIVSAAQCGGFPSSPDFKVPRCGSHTMTLSEIWLWGQESRITFTNHERQRHDSFVGGIDKVPIHSSLFHRFHIT